MPCVVESGLEAREADSFEYRRAALDRLRDASRRGVGRQSRRDEEAVRDLVARIGALEAGGSVGFERLL